VWLALLASASLAGITTSGAMASEGSNPAHRSAVAAEQTPWVALAQPTAEPPPPLEPAVGEDGVTPVQKSLPDPATNEELGGERGTAFFALILGGTLIAAVVLALLLFVPRGAGRRTRSS
jgi:hypothetical protein